MTAHRESSLRNCIRSSTCEVRSYDVSQPFSQARLLRNHRESKKCPLPVVAEQLGSRTCVRIDLHPKKLSFCHGSQFICVFCDYWHFTEREPPFNPDSVFTFSGCPPPSLEIDAGCFLLVLSLPPPISGGRPLHLPCVSDAWTKDAQSQTLSSTGHATVRP